MNILYFSWGENSTDDFQDAMTRLGHTVCTIQSAVQNYIENPPLTQALENELQKHAYDFMFSFDYLPFISETANAHQIKYVSWVYDCPHWTLYSPTIKYECNYIFLFDQDLFSCVTSRGAKHAFHLPLACNTTRTEQLLKLANHPSPAQYQNDLSFVGSLYEKNTYRQIQYLPDTLRGYLDGISAVQKQLWGCNLIKELLTPEKITELKNYIHLEPDPACPIPATELFQDMILTKITSEERIAYLNTLAASCKVSLYTNSEAALCPGADHKGILSYKKEMPAVFHRSKINLNITLRSITSGIPLRALDIMGCGGFLLTNYQRELAEYFKPDQEFVYFDSLEDLVQKVQYYFVHETERERIARAGYQKVRECFSYEIQLQKIVSLVMDS